METRELTACIQFLQAVTVFAGYTGMARHMCLATVIQVDRAADLDLQIQAETVPEMVSQMVRLLQIHLEKYVFLVE
ncbi:hypothetical protein D3C74_457340 [compost metagenome]